MLESDAKGEPMTSCIIERDTRRREDLAAAEAAAEAAEAKELDNRILALVRSQESTSQDQLRLCLGAKRDRVVAATSRLLTAGLIARRRQRDPYTLTTAGTEVFSASRPQSSPVVPESSPGGLRVSRPQGRRTP